MALNWDRARKQALEIDNKYNTVRSVTPGASSSTAYVPGTTKYTAAANITPKRTVTTLPNVSTPTADRARLGLATGGNPVSDSLTRFVEKKQTAPPPEVETPISSMNFTKGLGYGSERAGAAMLGAAENITDLIGAGFWKGVQGITSAGGLLPNPVSEYAERAGDAFLDNSVTRDWEESIRARYQPTQAEEAVTGVGQTVLQMLPGIGAAKAVSAAGNAANALNASNAARAGANAGRAVFGLQAAGGGANEARAEGAATGQALAYGAASGLLETAIESIAGGVPGLGKGKVREIAGAVISNPVVGKALDIAGEGGEEALSAVLSPYLKRAIYDSDAEHATAEEIAQSAVMGALAAGVLQAGLELPGAISNTVSQVQSTRASAPVKGALLDSLNQEARRPRAGELGPERGRAEGPEAPETSPRRRESDPTVRESERVIVTSSGKSALDGQNSLAKTLAENIENISDMAPVAALTGMEMNQRNKKPSDQIRDFFSKVGSVFRRGFGTVSFGEYGVGGILNHRPLNRAKMVSLVAVPDVIRNGRIISDVENWKGRGYRSVIFAAPATINDTPVYIAAVVNQNPDGKFYLNECVDSEGNYIRIENSSPNGTKSGVTVQDGVTATPGELFSASIIADSSAGGNTNSAPNGPESSVGAAQRGFDRWSSFQGTRSQFFPEGANAARPVDVPTTDPQGRPVRRTASTAMGAKSIPDDAISDIQNMVLRGELSYGRVTDEASVRRAVKTIEDKGYQGALEEFRSSVSKGVVSKDIATLGQQLLINAANAGDSKATAEILNLYAQMETAAGQAVQAASILRKLSPSDQLYAAQRDVIELEKTLQKKYKDLELTIDPALIEAFQQQTTQEGRDQVLDKIYQNVADQVPATWKDKWNAWRYLAMLANPRTHVRNVVGNVGFQPLRMAKDRVAAAIEAGVSRASGGKLQRTKSFAVNPELFRAAWGDWANVKENLSGSKYNDVKSQIESRRRVFTLPVLEGMRKGNSSLLELEDAIFKRITYADALAGYLQANGVTADQIRDNTVDAQLMAKARDYAGQEALRATYQDRNAFSDKVVQVANVLGPFGEAVLPFKRTPANILVRGFEYSPAGLSKALTADLYQVKQGNMTGAEAIDHIAAGLTGSGLFALGAYLFAQGIVTSGGGDDEKQDEINDLTGGQNYALNLPGGGSVTLDWLAPEALPFFMGVELMDSMGQNGFTAESIMDSLSSISEPMLELSMLQSLNDLIDSVSYAASSQKIQGLVESALISYFTQAVPTLLGQLERTGEDKRMSTYTDQNKTLPTNIQYALGRASARIPGWDYQQIPYIDAWGREEKTGTLPMRIKDNFLNPAYTSSMNVTPVDEEIQRLYNATGNGAVVPSRPNRYITVDKTRINLSKEQYVQYATERGQTQFSMLEDLLDSPAYADLSDEEKAAVVDDVYTYADAVAKEKISSYKPADWIIKTESSGVSPSKVILYREKLSSLKDGGMSQREANAELRRILYEDSSLTASQKSSLDKAILSDGRYIPDEKDVDYSSTDSFTVSQMSDGAQKRWPEIRERFGISPEEYAEAWRIYNLDKDDGVTSADKKRMLRDLIGPRGNALYSALGSAAG